LESLIKGRKIMDAKLVKQLNKQVAEEINSAYLYLAMAADFEDKNLPGMAGWMYSQYHEEMEHGKKIYKYIIERGERAILEAIGKPQESWDSPEAVFEASMKHEKYITGCINKLYKLAVEADDVATQIFLQWFITEQVEEEASVDAVLKKLAMVGKTPNGLYLLDKELGARGQH
jgi:ferritin